MRLRGRLVEEIREGALYRGLETERILIALLDVCATGERPDMNALAPSLDERDRRLLFEIGFEGGAQADWDEAESCLGVLRRRKAEEELATVQRQIETQPHSASGSSEELRSLLTRKQELRRRLQELPS